MPLSVLVGHLRPANGPQKGALPAARLPAHTIPACLYRQWLIAQKEAAAAEEKRLLEEEEANREVKSLIRCCAMHCAARLVASRAFWLL